MKRLGLVACAIAMLFAFTGCGSGAPSASAAASSSTFAPSSRAVASSSSEMPAPDSAPAGAASIYVQVTAEAATAEYYPSLVLSPDGTFMFTANLYEGMGHVWGTYTADGQTVQCTVVKRDFAGFSGDAVEAFSLAFIDESTLQYSDTAYLGMTGQGAVFTLDNQFPAGDAAMPDVLFTVSADADGGLNLRAQPDVASQSFGLIPKGSVLEVWDMAKNYADGEVWYQVRFEDNDGWVSGQYTVWIENNR